MEKFLSWLGSLGANKESADQFTLVQSEAATKSISANEPGDMLLACMSESNLFAAWEKVKDNDGAAGTDGITVAQYARNVLGRLQMLKSLVLKCDYRPQPLKQLFIEKNDGGQRKLSIPSVQDRILQTAVTQVLSPLFDKEFESASYGYRRGKSVAMAVARVCKYRDEGFRWVVDADIEQYFDRINHKHLYQLIEKYIPDPSLRQLIGLWISIPVQGQNSTFLLELGVPQGSPLSPLLANLYLDQFDEAMHGFNHKLVRFADDFVVLCRSRYEAEQALLNIEKTLKNIKLSLNAGKTSITSFSESFNFLGVRFSGQLTEAVVPGAEAWVLPDKKDFQHLKPTLSGVEELAHDSALPVATDVTEGDFVENSPHCYVEQDTFASKEEAEEELSRQHNTLRPFFSRGLYVGAHGHVIRLRADRIEVFVDKVKQQSIPIEQVDRVLITGRGL